MPAAAALSLALAQETRSSNQQAVGLAAVLPAERGTHQVLQQLVAGILPVEHQAAAPDLVVQTAVCPAALVQKARARSRSSRQSIRLICRP